MRRTVLSRCLVERLLVASSLSASSSALPHCCSQSPAWTSAAVLLGGVVGRLDHAKAAFAADRFACGELRALLLEPRRLFVSPCLLASLALGLLLGQVLLDRGRRDPLGELARAPSSRRAPAARRCPAGRRSAVRRCRRAAARGAGAGRRRARPRASARASSAAVASRVELASRPARRAGSGRSPCPACSSWSAARRRAGAPRPPPCRSAAARASRAA